MPPAPASLFGADIPEGFHHRGNFVGAKEAAVEKLRYSITFRTLRVAVA